MAKEKKRKKKSGSNPPLTLLDKFIYWVLFLVFSISSLCLVFFVTYLQRKITFSSPSAVAFESNGSFLFTLPLILHLIITGFVLFICGLEYRIPLFGNPKIGYGVIPYKNCTYPIFKRKTNSDNKKVRKKKWYKKLILVWCIIFLISAFIFPLGICGRRVLGDDGTITVFNAFNQEKQVYSTEDYDKLTISTYRDGSRGGSYHWRYQIEIKTNKGKSFSFTNKMSEDAINEFIEIKKLFDKENITIKGEENLSKVIRDNDLNAEETKKLKLLFSE